MTPSLEELKKLATANAAFIAAANPTAILALIERCERAEAENEALTKPVFDTEYWNGCIGGDLKTRVSYSPQAGLGKNSAHHYTVVHRVLEQAKTQYPEAADVIAVLVFHMTLNEERHRFLEQNNRDDARAAAFAEAIEAVQSVRAQDVPNDAWDYGWEAADAWDYGWEAAIEEASNALIFLKDKPDGQ